MNRLLRPPLKWAGGKRWLVPHLRPLWSPYEHRRLVEPFCGGLAVTLGLLPLRALLNDVNPHAINFYRHLKKGLANGLRMKNEETFYYRGRDRFNELIGNAITTSEEAAQLFYYLNRTCYNGLCRFSRKGNFNVPFGKYTTINYAKDFLSYKDIFKSWIFKNTDFEKLKLDPDDFVYADPPYDVEFTQYAKESFSWNDQERLAVWLSKHPGPVVLSNAATPRIVKLYRKLGYALHFLEAPRMISCTGDRTKAKEVVATRGL